MDQKEHNYLECSNWWPSSSIRFVILLSELWQLINAFGEMLTQAAFVFSVMIGTSVKTVSFKHVQRKKTVKSLIQFSTKCYSFLCSQAFLWTKRTAIIANSTASYRHCDLRMYFVAHFPGLWHYYDLVISYMQIDLFEFYRAPEEKHISFKLKYWTFLQTFGWLGLY